MNPFYILACREVEQGQFSCDNGKCVNRKSAICQNEDDCGDGSDESLKVCGKF